MEDNPIKRVTDIIHNLVPKDEIDSPLSKFIGVHCYLKCTDGPNDGLLNIIGTNLPSGEKVRVEWERGEIKEADGLLLYDPQPTTTPKEFVIKHLQKNYKGEVILRAYPVNPKGAADLIGILARQEEIIPISD